MLRYCAWCGEFQGETPGRGHQVSRNLCDISTSTICPGCLTRLVGARALELQRRARLAGGLH